MSNEKFLSRDPDGRVVIYDGPTRVRIDPAALPPKGIGADLVLPPASMHSTLGAVRDWCEPRDTEEDAPAPGSICGVALDPAQTWWTLGQILGPLSDDTRIGLARIDIGSTPAIVVLGDGWDVLIAGLDPRKVSGVPDVQLSASRVLRLVRAMDVSHE